MLLKPCMSLAEAIASTSHEERRKFLETLQLLHSESNDPHLSRPWFVFKEQVASSVRHAHTLMRFIESNAIVCHNPFRIFYPSYTSGMKPNQINKKKKNFLDANQECYKQYKQPSYNDREGDNHISCEAAGRTFWIDGQFDNAIEAVKHDHYSLHFLRGKGKIEYNVLRVSFHICVCHHTHPFRKSTDIQTFQNSGICTGSNGSRE